LGDARLRQQRSLAIRACRLGRVLCLQEFAAQDKTSA